MWNDWLPNVPPFPFSFFLQVPSFPVLRVWGHASIHLQQIFFFSHTYIEFPPRPRHHNCTLILVYFWVWKIRAPLDWTRHHSHIYLTQGFGLDGMVEMYDVAMDICWDQKEGWKCVRERIFLQ